MGVKLRNIESILVPVSVPGTGSTAAVTPVIAPAVTVSTALIGNRWVVPFKCRIVRVLYKVVVAAVYGGANTTANAGLKAFRASTALTNGVQIATGGTGYAPAADVQLVDDGLSAYVELNAGDIVNFTHTTTSGANTNLTSHATYVLCGLEVQRLRNTTDKLAPAN